jgi:RND family efflux transporter MFP subunit
LAGSVLLSGCAHGTPTVKTMTAQLSDEPFTLETKAKPEALHVAPVVPSASGAITSDIPDVGKVVNAGDVLFQIDSSQYESQASDLRAKIAASAQQQVQTIEVPGSSAAGDNSMEASLLRQGIITRAEYERIKGRSGGGTTTQQVVTGGTPDPQLTASLNTVEKAIANCTVRAPISGVISQVYIGDNKVAVTGKPALVIRQDSPVIVSVNIPSKMDDVLTKAKDEKTLTVTISDNDNVWYGELKPQPNENKSPYTTYKIQVDNPDDQITIGNEYNVRIESGQNVKAFMIPKSALIGDDTVAVVTDDNLVDMKKVDVASETGGYILIMDGLAEGDKIITNPPKDLEMGEQVKVN